MHLISQLSIYLLAAFFIYAGISHFRNPRFYIKITPPWVPKPDIVNKIVGLIECILGILLLIPQTRSVAAIGIMVVLILVFPANIYHHLLARKKQKHVMMTLIRLPLQLLLFYWAYTIYQNAM